MTLRHDTIVTVLALLVIAIAYRLRLWTPSKRAACTYVFSRQFLEELPRRFTGPGRLRFILQPMVAIVLGIRGGLADVKAGNPPCLFGLLFSAGTSWRVAAKRRGGNPQPCRPGIIMDIVFQLILYRSVNPGAAVVIGPILIWFPYALSRARTTRLAGWQRAAPHAPR